MDKRLVHVVDDDPQIQQGLRDLLQDQIGAQVRTLGTVEASLEALETEEPHLVLLDLGLPDGSGELVYQDAHHRYPDTPIIILTGQDLMGASLQALKEGCTDYLVKPVHPGKLVKVIQNALTLGDLKRTQRSITRGIGQIPAALEMIGGLQTTHPGLQRVYSLARTLAPLRTPILILGETGTGKDVLARAIHREADAEAPFVALNIAGLDDHLVSDALFGHKRGAFTGAQESREGAIMQARQGTLFLDEIGDLSLPSQIKLLRVLENLEYQALGSDVTQKARCRFIFATHQDLEALVDQGRFRKDLYFRINTLILSIPPLDQRKGDIPWLARKFQGELCQELGLEPQPLSDVVIQCLSGLTYPGNIRELKSLVRRLHFDPDLLPGLLTRAALSGPVKGPEETPSVVAQDFTGLLTLCEPLPTFAQALKSLAIEALRRSGGNQAMAARMLGLSPQAFHHRLKHWDGRDP